MPPLKGGIFFFPLLFGIVLLGILPIVISLEEKKSGKNIDK